MTAQRGKGACCWQVLAFGAVFLGAGWDGMAARPLLGTAWNLWWEGASSLRAEGMSIPPWAARTLHRLSLKGKALSVGKGVCFQRVCYGVRSGLRTALRMTVSSVTSNLHNLED